MYRYSPHMRGANDSGARVRRRFHSIVTLLLLVVGTLFYLVLEWNNPATLGGACRGEGN